MSWLVSAIALAPAGLLAALVAWVRWLRRRTGAPRFVAFVAYAMMVLAVVFAVSSAVSILVTMRLDDCKWATDRARMLANGIAEAIYGGALVLTIELVAALWLVFATWRWHWSLRPPVVEGTPPYR
jgi:hypothetical protein